MVDDWQATTQGLLERPLLYLIPCLIVLGLLLFRGSRRFRGRSTVVPDAHALEWTRKLDRAEKALKRLGYTRKPGETVGRFYARLVSDLDKESSRLVPLLENLRDYEKYRWR